MSDVIRPVRRDHPRTNRSLLRTMVFGGRWAEWGLAFINFGFGLALLTPGDTLASPAYAGLATFGGEIALGIAFIAVALVRLFALTRNGFWRQSPFWRYVGATFGFVIFFVLTVSFGFSSLDRGVVSTAVTTYAVLALIDLGNIWRAAEDAGASRRIT